MVLVELQNACYKKLNRKMLEKTNICYIFEKQGFMIRGSRMPSMTFPCVIPIQIVPTMQKRLFTSSFQAKFLKIWFKKIPSVNESRGIFRPNCDTSWGQKTSTFHVEQSVQRYGHLKLKDLCERLSHHIYTFCSI